jgi:Asp-tRNA(Asn)/Glu-tRNA(Gln) amidotransferase A subunit family amidase
MGCLSMSIEGLTASQISKLMDAGKLTSERVARSCLDRIDAREPLVNAWAFVDPDHVVRTARELDKIPRTGPLHGIPIGFKDVFDTADMPTSHNSPIYFGNRPGRDSACVSVMRTSGALIFGKTETVEFAAGGRSPPTRNPHNLEHTPGGTSSGSAAAVADGMIPLSFGTQTSGSLIRPAAFTGIYALKPTFGAVSREGVKSLAHSLDTVGWYGRCVDDLALIADAFRVCGKGIHQIPDPRNL